MRLQLSLPVIVGILLTLAFNTLPVWLGASGLMLAAFVVYAMVMLFLSLIDEEVMGYGAALCVCNPANANAYMSFGVLMACLAILRGHRVLGARIADFARRGWWLLFVAANACTIFAVSTSSHGPRELLTDFKQLMSHTGFLAVFPLAMACSIRRRESALFMLFLVAVVGVATLAIFHFFGVAGVAEELGQRIMRKARVMSMRIGQANLSMLRTQVCIAIAGLAVTLAAIGVGSLRRIPRGPIALVGSGLAVFLLMQLASTGSALAMVMGMGTIALGRLVMRPTPWRIIGTTTVFTLCGVALIWSVFYTENRLAQRIDEKLHAGQIDRWPLWAGAAETILESPLGTGQGFTSEFAYERHSHNDFMTYFLSYGWLTGLLYVAGCGYLWLQLARATFRGRRLDATTGLFISAALGALTVYCANSMADMVSANIGYFQTLWALVLIPSTALFQRAPVDLPNAVFAEEGVQPT